MKFKLQGIFPAILTPFTRNGVKVDYDKACALADALASRGVHGIFVCGSTGEGLLMNIEERKNLAKELIDAVGGRINVIVQTGCLDTAGTIELTGHAYASGAHAAAVYTPAFYKYDDAALAKHFLSVARSTPELPVLLYNIPRFTGNSLSPKLIVDLAEKAENIVGMKDSSGDMAHVGRVIDLAPKNFTVINGTDEFSYQAYLTGAAGSVALTANVVPELFLSIFNNVKSGNLTKARRDQKKLCSVADALGSGALFSAYKEALRIQGYDPGYMRPPHRELTKQEKSKLRVALKHVGIA